jgi:hypothetical protein
MAVSKREPIIAGIIASFVFCFNPSSGEEKLLVLNHRTEEKYSDENHKGQGGNTLVGMVDGILWNAMLYYNIRLDCCKEGVYA